MISAGHSPAKEGPLAGLPSSPVNRVIYGDCIGVMQTLRPQSVDFILTDPPYICRYRSRTGHTVINDDNDAWLKPAFAEMHRVLNRGSFCLSFYGWSQADAFIGAWRAAGLHIVGHVVFRKKYVSSSRFLRYQHEQAYLLAKGNPALPDNPPSDVVDWDYTGNRLHPTQKSVRMVQPFIETFCKPSGVVLDPFCGSGSTLIAAQKAGRHFIGIELDAAHHRTASLRVATNW